MNNLPKLYFTMESFLFPMMEEEMGELTVKMKEFLRIVEMVKPSRFINNALRWCGLGRPMKDREKMLRAFFLKAVYDLPTTKGLIENLNTNPSLRRLCGWEYRGGVPSEATFSRAFAIFSEEKVCDAIHAAVVAENYTEKLVGHASIDSTAIIGREKSCRKNTPKPKATMPEIVLNTAYAGAFFQKMRSVTMAKRMNVNRFCESTFPNGLFPNQQQRLADDRPIQSACARCSTPTPRFVGGEQQFRMPM